jgi:hypothetical protein
LVEMVGSRSEMRTEALGADRIRAKVPQIIDLLRSWGRARVGVLYGIMCNLPVDDLWQTVEIDTAELETYIQQSVQDGIFEFGSSDFFIEDLAESLTFRICHESDIHFESSSEELVKQVLTLWHEEGITLYLSSGEKGSARRRDWEHIDPMGS